MSDIHTVVLNFEYSYLIKPKSLIPVFQSKSGLWRIEQLLSTQDEYHIIDNLEPFWKTVQNINSNCHHPNSIHLTEPSILKQSSSGRLTSLISVSLKGTLDFIEKTRPLVLKSYNQVSFKEIILNHHEFNEITQDFVNGLNKLASFYNVEIDMFSDYQTDFHHRINPSLGNSPIYILGNHDQIAACESQLRILVDSMIQGLIIDSYDISLNLIPLIGGADLTNFTQLAQQLNVNIYIPDLTPYIFGDPSKDLQDQVRIWLSARDILEILLTKTLISNITYKVYAKQIEISKSKLDLMLLKNQRDFLQIMIKHGTFIDAPGLGCIDNKITVFGTNAESVEESIHELALLTSQFYQIFISFTSIGKNDQVLESYLISLLKKNCSLTCNHFGAQIVGSSMEVKEMLMMMSHDQVSQHLDNKIQLKLRLELNNSQKDFISGKKNGKIQKILTTLNQKLVIKFKPYNEYNFHIDLILNNDINTLIKGVELFELELPCDLQFNVPDLFHKSIIGNGGSVIQSIMKKYNVFIKFSSKSKNETITNSNRYTFTRDSNVVIKCPQKNARNILLVKLEIDRMCGLSNHKYNVVRFKLFKSQYLLILAHNKLGEIHQLELEFGCFIKWPQLLDDFHSTVEQEVVISIMGYDKKPEQCAQKLKSMMPQNFEFKLIDNTNHQIPLDMFLKCFIPFKMMLGVEALIRPIYEENTMCQQIILSYYEDDKAQVAIKDLTTYLRENRIMILDKQELKYDPIVFVSTNSKLRTITNTLTPTPQVSTSKLARSKIGMNYHNTNRRKKIIT